MYSNVDKLYHVAHIPLHDDQSQQKILLQKSGLWTNGSTTSPHFFCMQSIRQTKKGGIMKAYQTYQKRSYQIAGKVIVGIDPGKNMHQAVIINESGIPIGNPFSFQDSYNGYHSKLWKEVNLRVTDKTNLVFAIEVSCNLWQKLTYYLSSSGYDVVFVNPLYTKQARTMLNNDYSKTDNKDALLIATNAYRGAYHRNQDDSQNGMHELGIAYDKLRKDYIRYQARLRSAMELLFPECLKVLNLGTKTSYYLLRKYIYPEDFIQMDIEDEAKKVATISRNIWGRKQLLQLQKIAQHSIGIPSLNQDKDRCIIDGWISLMEQTDGLMKEMKDKLIAIATPVTEFSILTNIMGIAKETAVLFLAEIRDIRLFEHYKQIEKYAGYNLHLSQSGNYQGARRISHRGNPRLRWILYRMTEETAKYIPEVRIKYLKRQIKKQIYRKNITACISQLLKLLFRLLTDQRYYEYNQERVKEMEQLDQEYQKIKEERKAKKSKKMNKKYRLQKTA